jgi:hypothetical protein
LWDERANCRLITMGNIGGGDKTRRKKNRDEIKREKKWNAYI